MCVLHGVFLRITIASDRDSCLKRVRGYIYCICVSNFDNLPQGTATEEENDFQVFKSFKVLLLECFC